MPDAIESTLQFWFGPLDADGLPLEDRLSLWFGKDDAVDRAIADRFGIQLAQAGDGTLDHWRASPRGAVALLLTLDQFPRNIYRQDPRAFHYDPLAQQHALAALEAGHDDALPWIMRVFVYMPLEHAEDLRLQERCMALFQGLRETAPGNGAAMADSFVHHAERHREVIQRFGRFPHRNTVLGRPSTDEELAFLQQPGSSF